MYALAHELEQLADDLRILARVLRRARSSSPFVGDGPADAAAYAAAVAVALAERRSIPRVDGDARTHLGVILEELDERSAERVKRKAHTRPIARLAAALRRSAEENSR